MALAVVSDCYSFIKFHCYAFIKFHCYSFIKFQASAEGGEDGADGRAALRHKKWVHVFKMLLILLLLYLKYILYI